jgi:hypothetical protein
MDDDDVALRNRTYGLFIQLGRAPTLVEVSQATGWAVESVRKGWQRLHAEHALVLQTGTSEIGMANPFSAVPTAHRVRAAGRWWYANCGWDALGVCAALQVDGDIETSCPDCAERIDFAVRGQRPNDPGLVFHCLVPASGWWHNIGFT